MRAAYASSFAPSEPLNGLTIGERPEPAPPGDDWVIVDVRASALNHHDLWSLRGLGLTADQLPMILGGDAAGVDPDGNEVVVHSVIGDPSFPDETLDPKRSLLSERFQGTLAERVAVPRRNLVPKPAGLSFTDAACLPTAWLTAYRMLTTRGQITAGSSVLIQGAGGGVATAATVLAVAMGARTYVTSRDAGKRERVTALGAIAVEPGARLPERVDVVIETVGAATMDHSLKSTNQGGRIVVSGATSGNIFPIDLRRVFFLQLQILGSTMGTREELVALVQMCADGRFRPIIDQVYGFSEVDNAFARLYSGDVFGKVVLDHSR